MKTVNITPKWQGIMPLLVHTIKNGDKGAVDATIAELMKLAKAMDEANARMDEEARQDHEDAVAEAIGDSYDVS